VLLTGRGDVPEAWSGGRAGPETEKEIEDNRSG